ncbi:MAG: helix-turn-helix domain-containing protein, partial [Hapalosiphonaceae cyanobacterium JJU2]
MGNIHKGIPTQQFTLVSNGLIRDTSLSDAAFRLICWVSSHSDSFEISFSGIAAMLKYGKDKIKATVKNAEQAGYLVRTKKRSPAGTFEWDYYV